MALLQRRLLSLAIALVLLTLHCVATPSEYVAIQPLADGEHSVLMFSFSQNGSLAEDASMFPIGLRDIARSIAGLSEFEVTLSSGRWHTSMWGAPLLPVPLGLELTAVFEQSLSIAQVEKAWILLANQLSGLLCASINILVQNPGANSFPTSFPLHPLQLGGAASHSRHGLLPREALCTENITPFRRLLTRHAVKEAGEKENQQEKEKAKKQAPLTSLLVGTELNAARHQIISLHYSHSVNGTLCYNASYHSVMSDAILSTWRGQKASLLPERLIEERQRRSDVSNFLTIDRRIIPLDTSPLWAEIIVEITTPPSVRQHLWLAQQLPWWLRVQYASMKVEEHCTDDSHRSGKGEGGRAMIDVAYLHPGSPEHLPSLLIYNISMSASCTLILKWWAEKPILPFYQYPADPSRGFDVGAACLQWQGSDGRYERAYSGSSLIQLPEPDYSMPFNAIMLTSCLIVVITGNMINAVFRREQASVKT
jgi:hypothetical protein